MTGEATKGLPIKTGAEYESNGNSNFQQVKTSSTSSVTFGAALVVGWEVKIEVKSN